MSGRIADISQRQAARIDGSAYLIVSVLALFANSYVLDRLTEPGDAAATVTNIAASEALFRSGVTLADLNAMSKNTAMEPLGIRFTELGADYLRGTMPVDKRTHQPYGLLHGGASVVLAETLGSSAGGLCAPEGKGVVGIEINANHLRGVREGLVTGTVRALHTGRSTQVWDIRIEDPAGKLVCVSRLTVAVIALPGAPLI
jgi:uncharacterized protein (TIGR00369 family)